MFIKSRGGISHVTHFDIILNESKISFATTSSAAIRDLSSSESNLVISGLAKVTMYVSEVPGTVAYSTVSVYSLRL